MLLIGPLYLADMKYQIEEHPHTLGPLYTWSRIESQPELSKFGPIGSLDSI